MGFSYGIDISKWQGEWKDPAKTIASGIDFVYLRGTNGTREDDRVREYAEICRKHSINFGLYCYFRPKYNSVEQAKKLHKLSVELGANMVPQLDIEHSDDMTPVEITAKVKVFIEECERLWGRPVSIYSAAWWWNPSIVRGEIDVSGHLLWVARYVSMSKGPDTDVASWKGWAEAFNKEPRLPYGWPRWDLWQFSADGNNKGKDLGFSSSHLDLNIVKPGVLEKLVMWPAKAFEPEIPDPEPESAPEWRVDEYTVKSGDGPIRIVRAMRGSTGSWAADAKAIWEHNGLKWTNARNHATVHPGQKLAAPGHQKPSGGVPRGMLRIGSKGSDVIKLQSLLKARGFYNSKVDGWFGPVTERAVKAFQRSEKIVVDGLVGPQTWGRLK